jgi:DNA-directed RNA polymerase subunit RPC12/RpoP
VALICKGTDCKEVMRPIAPPGGMSSRTEPLKLRCPKCETKTLIQKRNSTKVRPTPPSTRLYGTEHEGAGGR